MSTPSSSQTTDSSNGTKKSPKKTSENSTRFRLAVKTLFLTYPKCPIPKEEALEILKAKAFERDLRIVEYIVAQEKHEDGSDHLHVFLKLDRVFNCKDSEFWDLNNYHGNYQGCRSPAAVMKYCVKEGDFLTSKGMSVAKCEPWKEALELAKEGKATEALQALENGNERTRRDRLLHSDSLAKTFQALAPATAHLSSLPLAVYGTLFEWNRRAHTLLIFGITNVGKTTLATSLLPNALLTRHLDLLADYSLGYDGIILDDMSFNHLHDEAQIALLDLAFDSQVHVRYRVARIPAGTPRIITTNRHPLEVIRLGNPAIARRVKVIEWKGYSKTETPGSEWEEWDMSKQ